MEALFFWIFAIGLVSSGLAVILNRNPVGSAMSLVAAFFFLALLFLTLEAFFLFVVQIIVYAGAVMVLFLFIIMLLDIPTEEKRPLPWFKMGGVAFMTAILGIFFFKALDSLPHGSKTLNWNSGAEMPGAKEVGKSLFSDYILPFEATAVLLLMATVGVILLSRRIAKAK
ncbi:MAG: NADH-quinone oxidoreductase subunit J [Verrucomicrobiota bacterium]